jgi:hypothetical protein
VDGDGVVRGHYGGMRRPIGVAAYYPPPALRRWRVVCN